MIGIDFTWIDTNGKLTGSLEIFTCDLLDGIVAQRQETNFIIITHPAVENVIRKRFPKFQVYGFGEQVLRQFFLIAKRKGFKFIKKLGLYELLLKFHGIERIWIPVMVPHNICYVKTDFVGTCHDLMTVSKIDNEINYKSMFEHAKLIVTISHFVKRQIVEKYNISQSKIVVIPNSIYISKGDIVSLEEISYLKGKKFLLDCNAYAARKNTLVMIKAFEHIADKIEEDLVLCGGYQIDGYFDICKQYIEEHNLVNRIHMFLGIDERQKNWLFQNCSIFITPSENEGFGRTPIEAALFLKPVISSKATSLEEATCGMVHYIENPRDDNELAKAMLTILDNPDSPERLLEIKNVFTEKYCAEQIVQEYMDVFYKLGWIQ